MFSLKHSPAVLQTRQTDTLVRKVGTLHPLSSGECSRVWCWWQDHFCCSCLLFAISAELYFFAHTSTPAFCPHLAPWWAGSTLRFHRARDKRRGLEMAHINNICPVGRELLFTHMRDWKISPLVFFVSVSIFAPIGFSFVCIHRQLHDEPSILEVWSVFFSITCLQNQLSLV